MNNNDTTTSSSSSQLLTPEKQKNSLTHEYPENCDTNSPPPSTQRRHRIRNILKPFITSYNPYAISFFNPSAT